jgi:hypothetical protein
LVEILAPAAQDRIDFRYAFLDCLPVPLTRRFLVDTPQQFAYRLLRRLRADVGLALVTIESSDRISEEVETLLGNDDEAGLSFVDREAQSRHQLSEGGHRLRAVSRPAANDQIIRIIDDPRLELPFVAELFPSQHKSAKVQIGEHR